MKKTVLLFSLIMVTIVSWSQITLTSADMPVVGLMVRESVDTLPQATLSPGSAGTAQTWDVTAIQSHKIDTSIYLDPAMTPYGSNYPGATVCQAQSGVGYIYIDVNSAYGEILGIAFPSPFVSTDTFKIHLNRRIINFPANYLDEVIDTSSYMIQMYYGQSGVDSARMKSYTIAHTVIDGWGSLVTPEQTFSDVLRIRTQEITTDSVEGQYMGFWIPLTSSKDTTVTYEWWRNGQGSRLASVKYASDTLNEASYLLLSSVNVAELSTTEKFLTAYPNPADETLNLYGLSGEGILTIYDALGNIVAEESFVGDYKTLNTESLKSGVYFIKASTDNRFCKVFIIH